MTLSNAIRIPVLVFCMLLASCSGSVAPLTDGQIAELQALVDASASDDGAPGVVLAVDNGGGLWIGAAGKADVATGEAMTADAQVRLASVTKSMTAMLIMQLVEEGTLSLADTVERWLPGRVVGGGQITIHMLLNHTSGIYDHESSDAFDEEVAAEPDKEWTADEVLAISNAHGLDFTPGSQWSYSNTGYYILGMIAEAATGNDVEDELEGRIFAPHGIERTRVTKRGFMSAPYAHGYTWIPGQGGLVDNSGWNLSWDWTAGSGVSTAADMIALMKALMGGQIVGERTLSEMITPLPPSTRYGYGIEHAYVQQLGEDAIFHDGANAGTRTYWLYFPERGWYVFVALNRFDLPPEGEQPQFNASALISQILIQVVNILKG